MEGIKETDLNLQREVVTTLANTWLVEAVNPSTGEKKMINIANYASVVAGQMKTDGLFPFADGGVLTDANTAVKSGIYRGVGSSLNTAEGGYGVLLVFYTNNYVLQQFVSSTAKLYSRFSTNDGGTWTAWAQL